MTRTATANSALLSAYRFMWLMVMFDLPVGAKPERRAATKFRYWLLDQGYEMSQFSIYVRFCVGKEQVERRVRDIAQNLPGTGRVNILSITDRQLQIMARFDGRRRRPSKRSPNQLELF